jgi:acyl carrier protein
MKSRTKILDIILKVVQSLNEERPENEQLNLSESTLLFGEGAELDSLSLVSLIVDIETAVTDEWDECISLTDDRAMDREISPFTDVRALTDYVFELLLEKKRTA